MLVCTRCGQENPEGFRFCGACGAALVRSSLREERKVVTVLFADLVGFTSRSERLDPEDVRAMLAPYFARVRAEIDRYGGTVEKFIGDAVMALFGAPQAHEDDPERAVRAALAIRDSIAELNESEGALELQLRLGVTTGEALVALGARPDEGEGMASGDVVNTAARLQTAAPVNGILVGETTYRATRHSIAYRDAGTIEAKGKAEPVPVWEALEARARFGSDFEQRARTPLVGREREVEYLAEALARSRRESSCQLVTLVGVPGIGKTRLLTELFSIVDRDPDLIVWRQGRSLPYGESMSYWGLAEIVKSEVGILETDTAESVAEKLAAAVGSAPLEETERDWVERHLRPLVGLATEEGGGGDRRTEAFSAWRRFVEALAERQPVILVFEDLHWADEGLLDFVDYLADWASGVPLLIVCTARPELLDRRAGWGGGKRNAATLSVNALSPDETTRLVGGLLDQTLLPAELQTQLLARSEGNPLYAEEYVRMLQDRGFLVRGAGGWQLESNRDLPLPETVQGLVAARLDALSADEKALVLDASVLGKVFWPGALTALGDHPADELVEALHALERKEFVRRERRSAVAGETQYVFLHILVRDVAYGQLPRPVRVTKHRLAAEWLESLGSDRSEDRAEMLAHHYAEALGLARAAGVDAGQLAGRAVVAFTEAADRALALNAWPSAVSFAASALELVPETDLSGRAHILLKLATARTFLADQALLVADAEAASELFRAIGDPDRAAEADILLYETYRRAGDTPRAEEHLARAESMVRDRPISAAKGDILARKARAALFRDEPSIELGRQALAAAEELGREDLAANALNTIGMTRVLLGDPAGVDDVLASLTRAESVQDVDGIRNALNNLANMLVHLGRIDEAYEYHTRAREESRRMGDAGATLWFVGEEMGYAWLRGRWDETLALAGEVIAATSELGFYQSAPAHTMRADVLLSRGEISAALEDSQLGLDLGRRTQDFQVFGPAAVQRARALHAAGREREATGVVDEVLALPRLSDVWIFYLPLLLVRMGRQSEYLDRTKSVTGVNPWVTAGRLACSGDLAGAVDIYAEIGTPAPEAEARMLAAGEFARRGAQAEADFQAGRALDLFRRLGAGAYVAQAEALLSASA